MSRTKKSRKPGNAPTSASKEEKDKKKKVEPSEIRFKKSHGKAPGNRQQEAFKPPKGHTAPAIKKDPRIGSKTPIVLTKVDVTEKQPKAKKVVIAPMAKIRQVDSQQAELDELHAIKDDAQIQTILQKQDQDVPLTESEIEYFNEKMDRHSILREKLGLTDHESESDQVPTSGTKSDLDEDAIWDKLDTSDFSDFE